MYYAMYVVGFALMMLLNVFSYDRYRTTLTRAVFYTLLTYFYGVGGAMLMGRIYTAVSAARGASDTSKVAIFGAVVFTPLFLLLTVLAENLCYGFRPRKADKDQRGAYKRTESPRDTLDLLAPGIFIILTCAKLGCSFEGCCFGVECSWGVHTGYHPGVTVFPVQLFEVATMCVVILLCRYIKRTRFYRRGMAFPLTAAFYTVARFGWEFKRYYAPEMRNILFGLTFWQLFCAGVFFASVISLCVLYRLYPAEPLPKKR